ncbi:HNH endonuclease family protein [Campylobacter jejuni]|nr:HNH endonuclease family protein [Campylobacter jejuni]MCW1320174.1 HNH endonuclease family protein [Campylobacter jejuni]
MKIEDKYVYLLRYLRHEIYWTSILTTALFNNYEYFDELKKLLLSYYYKNWIAGNTIATIKQTSFRILKLVKEKSNIQEIKNEILENIKNNNMEENYIENLKYYYVYGKKWDKPILLMLEYFATDNNHHSFIPLDANIQIEHILPIKYKEYNWDKIFTEDEREKWTNSLANLTLISMRKNVQALNYDFARKKEIYANKDKVKTCYTITQDIIHNYNEWDVNSLERRKKELIEKITNILSF